MTREGGLLLSFRSSLLRIKIHLFLGNLELLRSLHTKDIYLISSTRVKSLFYFTLLNSVTVTINSAQQRNIKLYFGITVVGPG